MVLAYLDCIDLLNKRALSKNIGHFSYLKDTIYESFLC